MPESPSEPGFDSRDLRRELVVDENVPETDENALQPNSIMVWTGHPSTYKSGLGVKGRVIRPRVMRPLPKILSHPPLLSRPPAGPRIWLHHHHAMNNSSLLSL